VNAPPHCAEFNHEIVALWPKLAAVPKPRVVQR
jgi:hypothetical protein